MVLYYGRARLRTNYSKNQTALMLSGNGSMTGRKGVLLRYVNSRVNPNLVRCGYKVDSNGRVVKDVHGNPVKNIPNPNPKTCGCFGCVQPRTRYSNAGRTVLL
jgi:hypothetical protein